jgi:glycosyltransferase involved in cell wall biosynthesis
MEIILEFTLVCDLMMDVQGPIRPALYLASDLVAKGYATSMASPIISSKVKRLLEDMGIKPINLGARLFAQNAGLSVLWFETWAREAFLGLNSKLVKHKLNSTINFSHTIALLSKFWYLQGPTSTALRDMEKELTTTHKVIYRFLKPLIEKADDKLVCDINSKSMNIVANSKFCASMYRKWGITVKEIIHPPIDCRIFQPQTSSPSSSYALTYFGKETKFSVIKRIADNGVKIKAFGGKIPFIPKCLLSHPNIEFLGKIPTNELVNAYSNALFTVFPFTHEPFGYIPIESMACGSPVLTYNAQGPSENVIPEYTGWLSEDDDELVNKALTLWKEGYPSQMRANCRKTASNFDKKFYVDKWLKLLENG